MNALLAVTIVLLLALLCQQIVRYLNYVAIGKIPTNVLLELVSFEVPYLLAFLLPLGLYLGILFAYGRMYADNEMAVLQMCGFGNRRIMRHTINVALLIAAVVLFLMLWINPWVSAKRQRVMASDETTVHLVQTMIPGRFQTSPDGHHVLFIEKLSRDRQRAENVFLAQEKKNPDSPQQNAWMLVVANQGYQEKDKKTKDQFFVTAEGYRYDGIPGQNDYKIIQFKKYAIRIPQNDVHVSHHEVETLSNMQLLQTYADPKHAAELQWRFSLAISAFILALLAVPLSRVRPRQGRYIAFIPAIIIYIVYINLLFIARHWLELGFVPVIIGMWWVHVVMIFFISLTLLISRKGWKW